MSYTIERGLGYPNSPDAGTLGDLAEEIVRARTKFPKNEGMLGALTEEIGELARALDGDGDVKVEALQVACVAIRLYEEGDATAATDPVYAVLLRVCTTLEAAARKALASLGADEVAGAA